MKTDNGCPICKGSGIGGLAPVQTPGQVAMTRCKCSWGTGERSFTRDELKNALWKGLSWPARKVLYQTIDELYGPLPEGKIDQEKA